MSHTAHLPTYRIEVRGWLDDDWSDWFEGLTVRTGRDAGGGPITVIAGTVRDQAALQGILTKIWSLNLPLLTVSCTAGYDTQSTEGNRPPTKPANGPTIDD